MSLMMELSRFWMDGAVRGLEGLRRGLSAIYPVHEDPPPITPYQLIYEVGKVSLRYYPAAGRSPAHRTPLLITYALIKRPFILDLLAGRSVIETLTRSGFRVYMIDWLPPGPADAWRDYEAYVNGDLHAAVNAVRRHSGAERISLMGYCSGAHLTTMYAALHPQPIKNLLALALPLDMSVRDNPYFHFTSHFGEEIVHMVADIYGNCPAWMVHGWFTGMDPIHHGVDKYVTLFRNQDRKGYAEMFHRFELWMNSEVPLAGALFRELSIALARDNALVENRFRIGGHLVNLKNITCPVLNLLGEYDDIVPPQSTRPFCDVVGSDDKTTLSVPTGHVGAVVSGAAHEKLWPKAAQWLEQHDE